MEGTIERSEVVVRQGAATRLAWGPIIGGAIAALSMWILLYALGLAVGLSAVDPANAGSLRGSGIFTGVWSLFVPLVALFVGGWVASRESGALDRADRAVHGLMVWGLTTLAGTWLTMVLLSALVGGALDMGRAAVQTGGAALGQVASGAGDAARSFGVDANSALAPVNRRLQAQGKPAVSADQLQAALRDVVGTALRTGQLDRNVVTDAVANRTPLSRGDAQEVAGQIEQQFSSFKAQAQQQLSNLTQTAQTGALKAADATGKAFWGVFGALFLGLLASVGGALAGSSTHHTPRSAQRSSGVPSMPAGAHPVHPT